MTGLYIYLENRGTPIGVVGKHSSIIISLFLVSAINNKVSQLPNGLYSAHGSTDATDVFSAS
jgi:hypothetical protein